MFLKIQKRTTLVFLSPVLLVFLSCVIDVRGQRAGSSMRDQARAIQRADMDRLLISSLPSITDSKSNRAEVLKQIRTDFKQLQELNNKMMATTWEREALDFSFLSEMISRIKGKADRLKMNLKLPDEGEPAKTGSVKNISSSNEYRAALLVLDSTIMRFVNNPLFRTPNTLEVDLAAKARQDLETVISLTAELKKTALRLSKAPATH